MRIAFAILLPALVVAAGASIVPAQADPYRWCAVYSSKGATNCGFLTWEQCWAAISGNGGFCNPNNFYDGRPVVTPEDGPARRVKRTAR
jgi:hypothetical protein